MCCCYTLVAFDGSVQGYDDALSFRGFGHGSKLYRSAMTTFFPLGKGCFLFTKPYFLRLHSFFELVIVTSILCNETDVCPLYCMLFYE